MKNGMVREGDQCETAFETNHTFGQLYANLLHNLMKRF